jgi:hypothetical protein
LVIVFTTTIIHHDLLKTSFEVPRLRHYPNISKLWLPSERPQWFDTF